MEAFVTRRMFVIGSWCFAAWLILPAAQAPDAPKHPAAAPVCSGAQVQLNPDFTFAAGSAQFSDPDGDPESGSLHRWLVNGAPLSAPQPVSEGLLLHFDGAAGGANGESPSHVLNVGYAGGKWGQALALAPGGGLRLARADNFDPAEGCVEMWVALRLDGSAPVYSAATQVLFAYRAPNGDSLYVAQSETSGTLYGGGTVGGQWQSAYGSANMRSWPAGQWHHLLFTFSAAGNFMRFYLDGVLTADTNEGHFYAPSPAGTEISVGGAPAVEPAAYWLDEVRLSGRIPPAEEIAARARRLGPPSPNEVWLPVASLAPGDQLAYEFTPAAAGQYGTPCPSAALVWTGIPIVNPQPVSTLLAPGSTSFALSVETSSNTTCAWSVGTPVAYVSMTPFDQGAGTQAHQTSVTGLDPSPLVVNRVNVRCAAAPDFLLTLLYRSRGNVNPSYPRTGNLWGWWGFLSQGDAYIARIDLWLGADFPPEQVVSLRQLNPDILILTSINAVENDGLPDDYYLKDVDGQKIEVWPGSFRLNMTKPYVPDYQARFAYQRMLDGGLHYDGVFFDNVMTTQSWQDHDIYGNPVQIDADEDGVADDPEVLDAAWKAGVFAEIEAFRALMPAAIVSSHSTDIRETGIAALFNGNSLGFVTADVLEGERSFVEVFGRYRDWLAGAKSPPITMVESSPIDMFAYGYDYSPADHCPASTQAFARDYYPWMRFGLALTLMDDGYFAQEWGDTDHGNDWWYDELDFALGQPLGPAERVDFGGGPPVNQVLNPGFEEPLAAPWSFWANGGAGCAATVTRDTAVAAEGSASARVDITATSGTDWHIEFAQRDRSLTQGVAYDVTFWARAGGDRSITVGSSQGVSPWTGYGLWEEVQIGTTWQEVTLSFEATATASDARLQFELGAATGTVWIDDVRLTLHPPDVFRREYDNGLAILNGTGVTRDVPVGAGFRRLVGTEAPAFQRVLDDSDAGFSTAAGTWTTETCDSGEWKAAGPFYHAWGTTLHQLAGSSGEARWSLPVARTDGYTVEAWWPAAPEASGWSTAATYDVIAAGRILASATFDQRTGGDEWHLVGEVELSPAEAPYVRLRCQGAAPCVADALHVRSRARWNDGSPASTVTLPPLDGIVLRRDADPSAEVYAEAGADAVLCPGEAAPLGGAPTAFGGTPPYTCAWTPAAGLDDPSSPNPIASPTADTTYTLSVSDSGSLSAQDTVRVVALASVPPPDVGDSLRLAKSGPDISLTWASAGPFGYDVQICGTKDFASPVTLFPEVPEASATHAGAASPSATAPLFYRVQALGCHH